MHNMLKMLPYRRVLGKSESAMQFRDFERVWGKWYGGACDNEDLSVHITMFDGLMDAPDAYDDLRRILADHGINRLFELREGGDGYELDLELASFAYNGTEGFWKSTDPGWMIYASHEASITFGGIWLIQSVRQLFPEFDRFIYKGWDAKLYAPSDSVE